MQATIWLQTALIHATTTYDKAMSMDRSGYTQIHIIKAIYTIEGKVKVTHEGMIMQAVAERNPNKKL